MASGPVATSYYTTRGLDPRKLRDTVMQACENRSYIVDFSEPARGNDPLKLECTIRHLGAIEYWQARGTASKRRTQASIDRQPIDMFVVTEQVSDGASEYSFRGGRTTLDLRPGDLLVSDLDIPFENLCQNQFARRMWLVPKSLMPDVQVGSGGMLLPSGVPTDILRTYLGQLRHALTVVPADVAIGYGQAIAPLLAAAIAPQLDFDGRREGLVVARRAQLYRAIDERLCNPNLSSAQVAEACAISPRTLHNLFAETGETFFEFVAGRRLDRARTLLADPDQAFRQVADIAFDCGFNTLSTFYAHYRDRFGEAPGDTRALAAGPATP